MKNKQNNNLAELFEPDILPFEVSGAPINTSYRVTINEDFREVKQFEQIVDVLDNAQPGDVMQIRLSTVGGALHAIVPLINAIQHTDAHVHVHVESDCASAGTILMMVADSCYVNDYANIMIHTAHYSYGGHSGNMDAYVKFSTPKIESFVREMYEFFLDESEIERVLDGKEIWMDAEECHMRFDMREELRQAAMDEMKEELEEVEEAGLSD